MAIIATCDKCNKSYGYPPSLKAQQSGMCPTCAKTAKLATIDIDIANANKQLTLLYADVCELNSAKLVAEQAYITARTAWEDKAAKYNYYGNLATELTHEKSMLLQEKTAKVKKQTKKQLTPEQQARKVMANLPPAAKAALLIQLAQQAAKKPN